MKFEAAFDGGPKVFLTEVKRFRVEHPPRQIAEEIIEDSGKSIFATAYGDIGRRELPAFSLFKVPPESLRQNLCKVIDFFLVVLPEVGTAAQEVEGRAVDTDNRPLFFSVASEVASSLGLAVIFRITENGKLHFLRAVDKDVRPVGNALFRKKPVKGFAAFEIKTNVGGTRPMFFNAVMFFAADRIKRKSEVKKVLSFFQCQRGIDGDIVFLGRRPEE